MGKIYKYIYRNIWEYILYINMGIYIYIIYKRTIRERERDIYIYIYIYKDNKG